MNQQEEWRAVVGHPRYEVSDLGRIKSYWRRKPHVLQPHLNSRGYLTVQLASPEGLKKRGVHQVVADAFDCLRPSPAHEVRHLNGDRADNRAENVRWGTKSENMRDAVEHGTHPNVRKTECPKGHPFNDLNTYTLPSRPNARYCRPCNTEQSRDRRRRARAAAARSVVAA